jgi:uncharacterized protein (DUF1499 family)
MDIFNDILGSVTGALSGLWPQPDETPHLVNGRLRPCPGTPNCVSSESENSSEKVDPLAIEGEAAAAWVRLKKVIVELGGTVRSEEPGYLWTTFLVPLAGFTDDVEFRLDETAQVIHVRSSSRLGFSDLGVNRGRVEALRAAFARSRS